MSIMGSLRTDKVVDNTEELTPKFAAISANGNGSNTVLAAVTGKKIRVLSLFLVATTAVTVQFKTAAAGAALTGAMPLGANGVLVLPLNQLGHFETVAGDLLNMVLGSGVQVSGGFTYVEV